MTGKPFKINRNDPRVIEGRSRPCNCTRFGWQIAECRDGRVVLERELCLDCQTPTGKDEDAMTATPAALTKRLPESGVPVDRAVGAAAELADSGWIFGDCLDLADYTRAGFAVPPRDASAGGVR